MTLTSFDWDVYSVEFPEVITSLVLGHKTSWHLRTVDVGSGVDNCRLHPKYYRWNSNENNWIKIRRDDKIRKEVSISKKNTCGMIHWSEFK